MEAKAETETEAKAGTETEAKAGMEKQARAETEAETRVGAEAETEAETRAEAYQPVGRARQLGWCHNWAIAGSSRSGLRSFRVLAESVLAPQDVHPLP